MRKTKFEKGITLVALIITIIVLLILAVVAIASVQESGIIGHADNSVEKHEAGKADEESKLAGYEEFLETKIPGENSDPNGMPATTIAEAQLDSMLTKTVNSEITDAYNNKIVVPAGFKILVDNTTGYDETDIDVTKGIVITDEINEFVWIPVGENITNGTKAATITLSRYRFNTSTGEETDVGEKKTENYYQELAESSYGNVTAKNLTGFLSSVNTNKGYYIARYEAGVTGYDSSKTTTSNTNSETNWTGYIAEEGKELKLVSKSGEKVWNYVTQNKASELCQNIYAENNNYISDLMNSYAWDTAIVFIQTFGIETDANKYSTLNKSTSFVNTGVNNDKYCNIHDMSGNATEWSTETYTGNDGDYPCVFRGGIYNKPFARVMYTASTRHSGASIDQNGLRLMSTSFRPLLYLEY